MTVGEVAVAFVTVTVPLAFGTTRIGATTRAVPAVRAVDAVVAVVEAGVDDAVVDVAARFRRRLPSGVAARVGLGFVDVASVGVRVVVLAAVVGVAVIAAVVGVAVVFVIVGVAVIAAVVGVAVVAAIVGVTAAAVVAPTVAAAVVPVPLTTTAPPPSPVMTGIGSELMDPFTVACGFAYADGGTS